MLLCWVCNQIKSERSGESPSLSTRKLCKTGISIKCFFLKKKKNKKTKNKKRGLRKARKEKMLFGKRFPKYIFLLFGACYTIVFQLDAVRFAIERIG